MIDNGGAASKKIYEIIEPDPDAATSVPAVNAYSWAYPSGSYNTEAAFMARGYLVLVTKTSPSARMYRFNTLTPGVTNKPTYIGKLMNSHSVSVARQSPDGKILVTASHEVVNLYRSTDGTGSLKSLGGKMPDCQMRAFPGEHVEAGEFTANREMRFITEISEHSCCGSTARNQRTASSHPKGLRRMAAPLASARSFLGSTLGGPIVAYEPAP